MLILNTPFAAPAVAPSIITYLSVSLVAPSMKLKVEFVAEFVALIFLNNKCLPPAERSLGFLPSTITRSAPLKRIKPAEAAAAPT